MRRFSKLFAFVLLLTIADPLTSPAASPPLPAVFYGSASTGGNPAPVGTRITALINGVNYAETASRLEGGAAVYSLDVPGDDPDTPAIEGGREGDTVAFQLAGLPAQSAAWQSGTVTRLDLSATLPPSPPVAQDQQVATDEDIPASVALAATDANGDPLTYTVVVSPTQGTLAGTPPDLIYTPSADYHGPDSFKFKANDGAADSNVATVAITVNPVPDPPRFGPMMDPAVDEGTTSDVTITAASPDGTPVTLSAAGLPPFATFRDAGSGRGILRLAPGYQDAGVYSGVTLTANAGGLSATSTLTVIVRDVQPTIKAGFRVGKAGNVALSIDGGSIVAGSSQWGGMPPGNAIDDDRNSSWCTANERVAGEWLRMALAGEELPVIDRVALEPSSGNQGIKDFAILASTTTTATTDFTAIYTGTVALPAGLQEFTFAPAAARYLELRILSNWGDPRRACVAQFQAWTRGHDGGIVSMRGGPQASIVASSGQFNSDFIPRFAIDENLSSAWASANGQTLDQQITVALGGNRTWPVDRVRIQPRSFSQAVKDFEIRVSSTTTDTLAFTTVFTGTVANNPNALQEFAFPPVNARYVQLLARNNYGSPCCIGVTTFQVLTPDGLNAARGEGVGAFVAGSSSQLNANQGPEWALDNNISTAWITAQGQAANQWIKVGLTYGDSHLIDRVRLSGDTSMFSAREFEVRVSNTTPDDAAFTTVLRASLPSGRRLRWFRFSPVKARYVQLFVVNSHGGDRIVVGEFQVFSPGLGGARVPFDDASVPALAPLADWHWDFGDGATSDERYPLHTYAVPGVYTATMTVTDTDGITGTASLAYTVLPPPSANFTWTPERPAEGQQTNFTDRSASTGGLLDWRWRFPHQANEATGSAQNVGFPDNGDYPVRLTVTDWTFLSSSITRTVSVNNAAPVVQANDATGWVGYPTRVSASVSEPGTADRQTLAYLWDLGDGQASTASSFNYTWQAAGTYTVTLQVTDKDGGTGADNAQYTIKKRPTILTYLGSLNAAPGEPVLLAARLRNVDDNQPVAGKPVLFELGGQTATGTTDANGNARADLILLGASGVYTLTASFAEDGSHLGSTDLSRFATADQYHQILEEAAQDGLDWLVPRQKGNGCWGDNFRAARTGFAVLKMETHAVQHGFDPLDPAYVYSAQIRKGLDCLFQQVKIETISMKPAGNPDSDGNGQGVSIHDGGNQVYQTGIAAMALASSMHPEMTVTAASPVQGWTYRQVLINVVDYLAWAQTPGGGGRGGWDYGPGTVRSDNSITGYATLGLVYAETPAPRGFGLVIPQFVKDELTRWVNRIQGPDGGSGYTDPGASNILRTGNLLQQMAFVGHTPLSTTVQSAIRYIERHWNDLNTEPGWKGDLITLHMQGAYTTLKGLEAMGLTRIATENDGQPRDWFVNMTTAVMNAQLPSGAWPQERHGDSELSTEWALLILEREAPPVVKYDLVVEVTDQITSSPILSATVDITGPEQRLGSTGAEGIARFPRLLVGPYTIEASASGYLSATTSITLTSNMTVPLALPPIVQPPSADAGGPYLADEGGEFMLDGSASGDPGNNPLTYTWELDGQSYAGVTATVKAVDDFAGIVALKVDNGRGGVDRATADVTIRNVAPTIAPIPDQAVDAGQPASLGSAAFIDPGVLDTHVALVEWGDGQESPGQVSEVNGSGTVTATHTYNSSGVYTGQLCVTDKDGGTGCKPFQVSVGAVLPDLTVERVDPTGLVGNWQELDVSGRLAATIANSVQISVTQTFTTTFFEDTDASRAFDPLADRFLGEVATPALSAGESLTVSVTISMPVRFRDDLIFAYVDSGQSVAEADETNNYGNTGLNCRGQPDLTASYLSYTDGFPRFVTLAARIGNGGATEAPAGAPVAFYAGDPASGGVLIGSANTSRALPPGAYEDMSVTWTLPPGGLHQIYVVANDPGGGAALPECTPENNTHHGQLLLGSDVQITKQGSAPAVAPGETLTYTVTAYNDGLMPAAGVVITDTLPAATAFVTATQGGTYRQDIGAVTWPPITLAAGGAVSYTLSVRLDAALPAGTAAITNTVMLAAPSDINPDNNRAVVVTSLRGSTGPDLIIPFMDRKGTEADFDKLSLTGAVRMELANQGQEPAVGPFMVTLFEDRDLDAAYTPATDAVLGTYSQAQGLAAGETATVKVPVSGKVEFRDNLIFGFIDSGDNVHETDEDNNYNNTSVACYTDVNGIREPAADITASRLRVDTSKLPASATITARIGNGGAVTVPAGLAVSFYLHDPRQPGKPIGKTHTTQDLAPGEYEKLTWVWKRPWAVGSIFVNADDPGTREGAIPECDESNNDPAVPFIDLAVPFIEPNDWSMWLNWLFDLLQ